MPAQPNIIWITVESTRFDHTSLSEYDRDTTPNMARISQSVGGQSFSNCFANGIWTRASMASMLTGTYVSHHQTGMTFNDRIPAALPTVAELLRDEGYHTICVPNTPNVSSASGLDRGFDDFVRLTGSIPFLEAPPSIVAKYILNINDHGGGWTLDGRKHSLDYVLTEIFKRKLTRSAADTKPFFGFLHLKGPHHPYSPPPSYLEKYLDDVSMDAAAAREFALQMSENLVDLIAAGCPFDREEWEVIRAMYDATLTYADHLVGDLFEFVSQELDDVVFVVTADHGELFGERDMLAHKLVTHDAVCNVPLVVHGPTAITGYQGDLLQHIDVISTILAEVGADTGTVQGYDLTSQERPYCVIQRGGPRADRNLEKFAETDPEFDSSKYHRGLLTALRTPTYKYERSDSMERLYRLPDETTDRSDENPEVLADLRDELSAFLERDGKRATTESQTQPLSGEMKRQLSDLGYLVE